uniref:cytochrome c biogenesis B n=1 Tax=Moerckia flotoviana TaxID=71401 RepID=UPI002579AA26|nr:cytochrome c biogenesis B [Moerckia flotoviana]WIA66608.1 cytochrome c biogenesis B [Moerckia flotoviana]
MDLKTKKKELISMVFALRALKIFLKLFHQHILLSLSTLITTFSSSLLYIVATPSTIGFSKDFLCHFYLGLIWIRSLFASLPERFFRNDFEDGTPELYYLSGYCLQKIPLSKLYGHWVLQISGVFRSFPVLQLPYQFDQSKMNWFTIIIGSQIFTPMCGIHSRSALGITSNGWNSLQNLTTSPTLSPSIVFCTSIETEWFHVISLMGYLLLFLFFHPILVSIIFRTLLAKR